MKFAKFFLGLVVISGGLAADHTTYTPPVFFQGNFFEYSLQDSDKIGGSVRWQYEQAINPKALGRYLGPDGNADFTVGPRFSSDLYSSLVIHQGAGGNAFERQSVALLPSLRLQKIDMTFFGRLFPDTGKEDRQLGFFANLCFASVEQRLGALWQPIQRRRRGLDQDFQDFFEGNYASANAANRQAALNAAKFYRGVQRAEGPSSVTLGFVFQREVEEIFDMQVQGIVSLPCGKKDDGTLLLAPRQGMGPHLGVGVGVDVSIPIKNSLQIVVGLRDMYCIPEYDVRTIGIKFRPFSYYLGLARSGQQNEPVTPAANILTQKCWVSPGHALTTRIKVEGSFSLGHKAFFSWQGMHKEAEQISLAASWHASTYAIASGSYDTRDPFQRNMAPIRGFTEYHRFDLIDPGIGDLGNGVWLQEKDLDFAVGAMPAFFEQALGVGWEYVRDVEKWAATCGPRIAFGCRLTHGENSRILPNFFTTEIGYLIKF